LFLFGKPVPTARVFGVCAPATSISEEAINYAVPGFPVPVPRISNAKAMKSEVPDVVVRTAVKTLKR